MAIVADDRATGRIVGLLLGTLDTQAHNRFLVRRHGVPLAASGLARTIWNPSLGKDFLKHRAAPCARSMVGTPRGGGRRKEVDTDPARAGLLAHVVVRKSLRRRGVGATLVSAYETRAREAGLERLEIVVPPDNRGARAFYERLDWASGGEPAGKGGERFALYTRDLDDGGDDV
jgi:ribosomal protein S18 acetylase RimI-like enzyme